jgi:hypothetical protein
MKPITRNSSSRIREIIKQAGYRFRKAKKVLTSNDPEYRTKLQQITGILRHLKPDEKFFSVDEFGPFAWDQRQLGLCPSIRRARED